MKGCDGCKFKKNPVAERSRSVYFSESIIANFCALRLLSRVQKFSPIQAKTSKFQTIKIFK